MDGKEPMYVHAPKPSNAHQTFLDESGFNFITRCFQTLENRGLEDQGLYRYVKLLVQNFTTLSPNGWFCEFLASGLPSIKSVWEG